MRRTTTTALCLVAVSALSVAIAQSASAEPPEFQKPNKKNGIYEALTKPVKFTETGGVTKIRFQELGVTKVVECASSTGKGKLTGPKTFTLATTYVGCEETETHTACATKYKAKHGINGQVKNRVRQGELVLAGSSAVEPPVVAASMQGLEPFKCGITEYNLNSPVKSRRSLGALALTGEPTSEITITYAEGGEPEPGCGKQELQLVEDIGPCVHLGLTVGSEPEEPAWIVAEEKWKPHGTVSVLK
jgi:hypothetical protein